MVRWGEFVDIDMDMGQHYQVGWRDGFSFVWSGWMGSRQGNSF